MLDGASHPATLSIIRRVATTAAPLTIHH